MIPNQELITGWAAFGVGYGLAYHGRGSLATDGRDKLTSFLDSQACRDGFWQNCLSLHRCAEDNNGLIFTWRKPVSDAAGRPGYCAVAVALSEGATKAPAKVHGWLKGSASLVNELYRFGLTSAQGRFVAQPHELTSFVEERPKAFGISDPASAFDCQKQVQIANSRHVDYYMDADVFEQILKNNWLQLACAQLEGNVFFFEATRKPRMDDVRLLDRSGAEDLARRARLRLESIKSVPSQASRTSVPATLSPPLTSSVRNDHKEAQQPSATAIVATSNKESENLSHENTDAIASANLARQLEEVWRELRAMDERVLSLDERLASALEGRAQERSKASPQAYDEFRHEGFGRQWAAELWNSDYGKPAFGALLIAFTLMLLAMIWWVSRAHEKAHLDSEWHGSQISVDQPEAPATSNVVAKNELADCGDVDNLLTEFVKAFKAAHNTAGSD